MSKTHTPLATLCAVLLFVFLTSVSMTTARAQKGGSIAPPQIELVSPRSGDVLTPGQSVKVEWRILNADKGVNLDWCEQEIFLSLDGGVSATARISPQLDPRVTSFDWVVPNTLTKQGVLDIRIGCEGGAPYAETSRMQTSVVFQIRLGRISPETVKLASLDGAIVSPGDAVNLNWESNVEMLNRFDVMVSYDAGAHYTRAARTKDTSFSFTVPDDYAGSLVFQIVARKSDGTSVASHVDLKDRVLVKIRE